MPSTCCVVWCTSLSQQEPDPSVLGGFRVLYPSQNDERAAEYVEILRGAAKLVETRSVWFKAQICVQELQVPNHTFSMS